MICWIVNDDTMIFQNIVDDEIMIFYDEVDDES